VNKPEPSAEAKAMENETIVFTILNSGQIFYGKNEIGINAVRAKISELTRKDKLPVIIEVDNAAPAGTMVRIMDEATLAGAEAISLINLKAGQ
jgi:biopolymer transport protein ExbD